MKMNKKILSVLVLCLIFAMAISAVKVEASPTGTSAGTATVGSATPTIASEGLFNSGDSASVSGTSLTVLTEYHYNCTVGDTNGLYSLYNITFTVFSTTVGAADHNQTHYTYIYTNSTDAYTEVGPNAGGADLVTANCVKPTRSGTSSSVKLAFELQGVANYTSGNTWYVNCTVFAGAAGAYTCNDQSINFAVTAYYSIVVSDATHGWTGLTAGSSNNVTLTIPAAGYITVQCESNHYNFAVLAESASANLTSGGNNLACGNIVMNGASGTTGAIALTTGYVDVPSNTGLVPTDASSIAEKIYLYITIPAGTPAGSYTYTLNIEIAAT